MTISRWIIFLDNNDFTTTKRATLSLLAFERENGKQIRYKKQYQNEEEGRAQCRPVAYLDGVSGKDGQCINWSDILHSAWDSPELCEAGVVTDIFGYWSQGQFVSVEK